MKNVQKLHVDTNFPILEPKNSRHFVRSLSNYQKSIPTRYNSHLRIFQAVVIFIWRSGGLYNFGKKASQNCFLNVNVKYFLHTRTLRWTCIKPRKYFRWKSTKTISKAFSHKILPPEITKIWKLVFCYFGGYLETWKPV